MSFREHERVMERLLDNIEIALGKSWRRIAAQQIEQYARDRIQDEKDRLLREQVRREAR